MSGLGLQSRWPRVCPFPDTMLPHTYWLCPITWKVILPLMPAKQGVLRTVWLAQVNHPATADRSHWLPWKPQVNHPASSDIGHGAPHCSSKEERRREVGGTWIQILPPLVAIVKPPARWLLPPHSSVCILLSPLLASSQGLGDSTPRRH